MNTPEVNEFENRNWEELTQEEKNRVPESILNDVSNPLCIPWFEWPDVTKGLCWVAWQEGATIESNHGFGWNKCYPEWVPLAAYRIVKKQIRGSTVLTAEIIEGRACSLSSLPNVFCEIETIDGKPICGTYVNADGYEVKIKEKEA